MKDCHNLFITPKTRDVAIIAPLINFPIKEKLYVTNVPQSFHHIHISQMSPQLSCGGLNMNSRVTLFFTIRKNRRNYGTGWTSRPRHHCCFFANYFFKCIFSNENAWITPKISLMYVSNVPINSVSALVQIIAWRRPGNRPSSEEIIVSLLAYICVPQNGRVLVISHETTQSARNES